MLNKWSFHYILGYFLKNNFGFFGRGEQRSSLLIHLKTMQPQTKETLLKAQLDEAD